MLYMSFRIRKTIIITVYIGHQLLEWQLFSQFILVFKYEVLTIKIAKKNIIENKSLKTCWLLGHF